MLWPGPAGRRRSGTRAITSIEEQAWTPIRYPNAIYDQDEKRWVADAEVAEVAHFTPAPEPAPSAPS